MTQDKRKPEGKRKSMQGQTDHPELENGSRKRDKAEWIGQKLREFYDETASEPVPDRFRDLLRQLDEKSGKQK